MKTSKRSATIGTTYPVGNDTATMRINSSEGAEYGSAVKASHQASFQRSDSKFTKSSWGFDWKKTNQPRSYRKGIEYGLFELTCVRGCVKCSRTWWPIGETGGTGQNLLQSRPNWTKCDTAPAGRWWRDSSKGSSYENSAAVDFRSTLGFSLSIKRSYSKNQLVEYNLTKKRRLCGSDGQWPAKAGKVQSKKL